MVANSSTGATTKLRDYGACLLRHSIYCSMWLAECAKQGGNWFTFIAAYAVIAELSPADVSTHTALFLICRRLPYLLLFPVTGLAADRLNRGAVLVGCCLLQGAVSFSLPLVAARGNIGLLYPLILLQYSAQAFYDPTRTAAVPTVVPPAFLCVAGTLDTFGFSLMALGGASLAGRTAAVYGTAVCFRVEGIAFVVAAVLLLRLAVQGPAAATHSARLTRSSREGPATDSFVRRNGGHGNGDGAACVAHSHGGLGVAVGEAPPELEPLLSRSRPPGLQYDCGEAGEAGPDDTSDGQDGGCGGFGCGALGFLSQRANWDVAMLIWVKASGAAVWGAADVLNGRFCAMPSMQSLGGPDQTLGAILAAVGAGCVAGPLLANALTPGVARCWRVSIAASFGLLAGGYAVMAAAPNVFALLPATIIRASGSNTLWIHSLAILQHRLHDGIRGRVFALEYVLYTLSESASTLSAGWALDHLGWSTRGVSTTLSLLASAFMVLWSWHAGALWDSDDGAHHYQEQQQQLQQQRQHHPQQQQPQDPHHTTHQFHVLVTVPAAQ